VNRTIGAFVVLAFALGVLFVRLGFWQLDRRRERQQVNARVEARLAQQPVGFAMLPRDSSGAFRRAVVEGEPDYDHEIVFAGRSRNGSPGVHLITPVRIAGDRAVLVNRGWVYSPDAATVDRARWRESRTRFSGFTQVIAGGDTTSRVKERTLRRMAMPAIRQLVPYPVDDRFLVAQDSAAEAAPVRLDLPALDEGPHLSYAIQWFCFAAIAFGGAIVVVRRARRVEIAGSTGA